MPKLFCFVPGCLMDGRVWRDDGMVRTSDDSCQELSGSAFVAGTAVQEIEAQKVRIKLSEEKDGRHGRSIWKRIDRKTPASTGHSPFRLFLIPSSCVGQVACSSLFV